MSAEDSGVDGVTDRAGGSCRSSTAEKRYLEGGEEASVDCERDEACCGSVVVVILGTAAVED